MALVWGCIGLAAICVLLFLFYLMGGWVGLIGIPIILIIFLILSASSKEGQEKAKKYQSEKRAVGESQQVWQQASQSYKVVKCKTCDNEVAEQSAVCPKCGVALPGLRIKCPKCSSTNITVAKKGFNVGQAAAGGIAVGTVGLAAGMIGGKDSEYVCLGCGFKWPLRSSKPINTEKSIYSDISNQKCSECGVSSKVVWDVNNPYRWLDDIKKFRCEYCLQLNKYHYCKTKAGIERHIANMHKV